MYRVRPSTRSTTCVTSALVMMFPVSIIHWPLRTRLQSCGEKILIETAVSDPSAPFFAVTASGVPGLMAPRVAASRLRMSVSDWILTTFRLPSGDAIVTLPPFTAAIEPVVVVTDSAIAAPAAIGTERMTDTAIAANRSVGLAFLRIRSLSFHPFSVMHQGESALVPLVLSHCHNSVKTRRGVADGVCTHYSRRRAVAPSGVSSMRAPAALSVPIVQLTTSVP